MVRSQLDRKLRRAEDIERQFGVTVAATVPESPAMVRRKGGHVPLVVLDGPRKYHDPVHTGEAFLKLRTILQFMDIDNPPRVIVVTSPLPGDGKSTVAANLAAALSMADRKVVLIDGDLRRPVVAESFGLVEGAGLTDLLIGRVRFSDVAQHVGALPNLSILAAGGSPPNPSELLGSKAMRRLLDRLADTGHTVIIDAPPLLPVTDAAVLTASADGALVVVTAGQTVDSQLAAALGSITAVQGHALGVVLNRVSPKAVDSGYYGGYYGATPTSGVTRLEDVRGIA
jgi:capsular exopolysaccharide synthesis family protein